MLLRTVFFMFVCLNGCGRHMIPDLEENSVHYEQKQSLNGEGFSKSDKPVKDVAIAFWGLTRSLKYTHCSINRFIVKPLKDANMSYDVFMHTYEFKGKYSNIWSSEKGIDLDFNDRSLIDVDYLYVEDQDEFDKTIDFKLLEKHGDPWSNNFVSVRNEARQLHSQNRLVEMIEQANFTYNAVVFLRPDMMYLHPLPVDLIKYAQENQIYVPNYFHYKGVNDSFAFGLWSSMKLYGSRFQGMLFYAQHKPLQSETYLYDFLKENKQEMHGVPMFFRRVRATGHMVDGPVQRFFEEWELGKDHVMLKYYFKLKHEINRCFLWVKTFVFVLLS